MRRLSVTRAAVLAASGVLAFASAAVEAQQQSGTLTFDTTFFRGLSYRNVGPVRGGRSIAVAGSTSRPLEYWFGATGGGAWKTTDGGTTWRPMTDGHIASSSVGAIGVCEADPDIVYVGMGEVQFRGNIMQGDGIYRTDDGGSTWRHVGLPESQSIGRVRVHPTNCDIAYAAVLGHAFGPNPERGVYRTTDGGENWERVLFRSETAGAVDVSMDPNDPDLLFAGTWEVYRRPWGMYSGGPGSGLFRTRDGGGTWDELTSRPGLPATPWGKVGVSVSPADASRVYAIIEAEEGGVFRSDDGGETWERTNDERKLRQRAFYYTRIYADPVEKDVVYVVNTGFYKSTDGGESFDQQIRVPHGDNHDLWIASSDNQRMINANDGGGNVSFNGGETWTEQDFPTAQLYHVTVTNHDPYWICGAQQDNSTACMASGGWRQMAPFVPVGGGESGYIASDPDEPDVFYAGSYGGYLSRYDYSTGTQETITVWPENPMGHSSEDIAERFQWTYPIVFSRTEPKRLYVGSQHLWMTTDQGMSWERISPDLTRADPKTMGPSGGPITKDQTGVETYATIFTIAPSPHDANTIWTGSDDGYVQITRDHGATWSNVTPPELPEFSRISLIEVSPHTAGKAIVAAKRHQLDDRDPYIYRTTDHGRSWTKITNGIAAGHYVHVVREDPVRPGLLFAGTEHGVYISFDDGASWQAFNRNLPDVHVPNIGIAGEDLVIATHGRSAYVMGGIGPLRELTPQVVASSAHLFDPASVRRNMENVLPVTYYLADEPERLKLEFVGPDGEVVRSFTSGDDEAEADEDEGPRFGGNIQPPKRKGTNRFTWDMRHDGPTRFDDMILWAAGTQGPRVLPGDWKVRMSVAPAAGEPITMEQAFTIALDPRFPDITIDDVRAQHTLALQVRDRTSQANEAVIAIRDIKAQIEERAEQDATVKQPGDELAGKLTGVEGEIYQYRNQSNQDPLNYPIKLNNKLAALLRVVEGVHGRPTAQAYEVFELLSERLDVELERMNVIVTTDLGRFNELLRSKGLDPIEVRGAARITT